MSCSIENYKEILSKAVQKKREEDWEKAKELFGRAGEILLQISKIEAEQKKNRKNARKYWEMSVRVCHAGEECRKRFLEEKRKRAELAKKKTEEEVVINIDPPAVIVEEKEGVDFDFMVVNEVVPKWEHKVKKRPEKKNSVNRKPDRSRGSEESGESSPESKKNVRRRRNRPSYAQGTKSSGKKNKSSSYKKREVRKKSPLPARKENSRRKSPYRRKRGNSPNPKINKRKRGNISGGKKKKIIVRKPEPDSTFASACCEGDLNIINEAFLDPFFNLDDLDVKFGLHFAAYHQRLDACKLLIQSGHFELKRKLNGANVLHYAQDDIVRLALRVFTLLHRELQYIIGLQEVKEHLYALANKIILDKKREREGHSISKKTYDMIFKGNPGTGKTSIASVICKMYAAFEIITNPNLKCVQRGDLVAGYIGKTALKTREVIAAQKGGILLVDEAYRLSGSGGKDFGKEAIEELMQAMNGESGIIFIFAGYEKDMDQYVKSNEGLFRRIAYRMKFQDFSAQEIAKILDIKVTHSEYHFGGDVNMDVLEEIIGMSPKELRAKMNGGMAQKLKEFAIDEVNRGLSLDAKGDDLDEENVKI